MDSTNQVLKDLEDLLPNRSLAPPAVPPEPGHQNVYSFDSLKQSLFFSQQSVEKTTDVASIVILYFYTNSFSIQLFKSLNIEWDFNFPLLRRQEMKTVIFCCCCCFGLGEFEFVTSGSCSPHVRNQEDFRNNFGLYSLFVHHVFNFN